MITTKPSIQSTTERRAAEASLSKLVAEHAGGDAALVKATRRALRKRLPTAIEIVYEYRDAVIISVSPDERGYEGVFAIRGDADGVKLYFNFGKALTDPERLLNGSGGQTRWIRVESSAMLRKPGVVALIEHAIANHRVPFAEKGRGAILIRETAASRRKNGKVAGQADGKAAGKAARKTTRKAAGKRPKR
ncbi:MAG: hypothetical protein HEQ23_02745 [Tepidisphaera sp.]